MRTGEEDGGEDETVHQNKGIPRISNAERDEKLRESLYELREMNNIFEGFLGALEDARGHNQVRYPVAQTLILISIPLLNIELVLIKSTSDWQLEYLKHLHY